MASEFLEGVLEWVLAEVQAQGALGGGLGMALLLLLHQTPSPSSSYNSPPFHFLWWEGPAATVEGS